MYILLIKIKKSISEEFIRGTNVVIKLVIIVIECASSRSAVSFNEQQTHTFAGAVLIMLA